MEWTRDRYRQSLSDLAPFLSALVASIGRSERRLAAVRYVAGLLLPARGKSIRPLADWLCVDEQSLQQFLTDSPWNPDELWRAIRRSHLSQLAPVDVWLLHERVWLKQGKHSVGVAHQRGSTRDKKAACQVSLEVLMGHRGLAFPIAGRMCLPDEWRTDTNRRWRARIPVDVPTESRSSLAITLLKEGLEDGIERAPLITRCAFADTPGFRDELRALGLEFIIECDPARYQASPVAGPWDSSADCVTVGRAPIPMRKHIERAATTAWTTSHVVNLHRSMARTTLHWRRVMVHTAATRPPEPLWLVDEWLDGATSPRAAYLAHLHGEPTAAHASEVIRSAQYVDRYQRCFEQTLNLGSYQGRSWNGFHHHLVLAAVASTFVAYSELRRAGETVNLGTPPDALIADETYRLASLI